MCNADQASRAQFARDVDNLTLAAPELNRNKKRGNDAAEWVPERNQCWFAQTVLDVRRKYGLTIDEQEAAALERILAGCTSRAISCTLPVSSEPDHPPVQAFSRYADMRAAGWDRGSTAMEERTDRAGTRPSARPTR